MKEKKRATKARGRQEEIFGLNKRRDAIVWINQPWIAMCLVPPSKDLLYVQEIKLQERLINDEKILFRYFVAYRMSWQMTE